MRVFDCCFFNITDKVKFKNTAAYIENMLSELSMNYTDIAFRLNCGPVSKAVEKYPELKKYYCIDPENNSSYLNENLTSFSENWKDGEIFIDRKDSRTVLEIFSKIPRPFNFSFATLIFSGINWYGNGLKEKSISKSQCTRV